MREEGKVRAAGCLRLELVGDAAAAVMDVAEAELAAAGAALADLAFVAVQDQAPPHDHCDLAYLLILASPEAVQARRPRAFLMSSTIERR